MAGSVRAGSRGPLQRLRIVARRHARRLAHVSPAGQLTYGELDVWADALAARLRAALAGAPPGRPLLVYGHKEPAVLASLLACARLGRPWVPADVSAPPARVGRMAALAGVAAALAAAPAPPELAAELGRLGVPLLDPAEVRGAAGLAPASDAEPAPEAIAYIIFTSGSTGDPKGVPIPWRALRHFARWLLAEQRPRPGREVVLNQAPFSFDLSVMDLCLALPTGATLFSISQDLVAEPRRLFAALRASGLTVWVSTPSFARLCLAEPSFGAEMLPALRTMVFCGETLPTAVARELLARFPRTEIWNTYGPTETTVAVTSVRLTAELVASDAPLPVGRAAPGMRVWVAGPDGSPLPEGERGEIVIAGPQVSPGYLAADPAAAERFWDLPPELGGGRAYRTGDAGRQVGPWLYCEGRLDRQVKLHGYRLELDEIEAHLRGLPGVADAAVVPAVRGGSVDHLVAFVVETAPGSAAPAGEPEFARGQALRAALARRLPAYAVPRVVRFLPALPLTANGKVDRRALEAQA